MLYVGIVRFEVDAPYKPSPAWGGRIRNDAKSGIADECPSNSSHSPELQYPPLALTDRVVGHHPGSSGRGGVGDEYEDDGGRRGRRPRSHDKLLDIKSSPLAWWQRQCRSTRPRTRPRMSPPEGRSRENVRTSLGGA